MVDKFTVGDRVRVTRSSEYYDSQGAWGIGTINDTQRAGSWKYHVNFDNDHNASYNNEDLELVETVDGRQTNAVAVTPVVELKIGDYVRILNNLKPKYKISDEIVGKVFLRETPTGEYYAVMYPDGHWYWHCPRELKVVKPKKGQEIDIKSLMPYKNAGFVFKSLHGSRQDSGVSSVYKTKKEILKAVSGRKDNDCFIIYELMPRCKGII